MSFLNSGEYAGGVDAAVEISSEDHYLATTGLSPFGIWCPSPERYEGRLSKQQEKAKMESVVEIFRPDEDAPVGGGFNDEDDDLEVDIEDQARRTERLRSITGALDQLWWSGPELMAEAAEKIADGSRDPLWRVPIGNCGLLDAFLMIASTENIHTSLMIHVLRLIGNSCADTDENRARVVARNSIPTIIALSKDDALLPFAIPVLFNICVDYEPAQKQSSDAHLSKTLIKLLSSPRFDQHRSFLGYICKLLDLLITQPDEHKVAPEDTVMVLLNLAASKEHPPDLEDFLSLTGTAIAYLQHPRFQTAVCKTTALDTALYILLASYTRLEDTAFHMQSPTLSSPISRDSDQDDAKELSTMRSNLNQVLSDISALPEFAARCLVISPMSTSLRRWLSGGQLQLQVCACIMLGNLARSDSACEEFVFTSQVHKPLIAILKTANDSQILYAALGFLKNLALPARNKVELGNADLIEVLPRLWAMDAMPQIQYSSISLARQLLIGNLENVLRINRHLSPDPDSPAYQKSRLSVLISLFSRTDAEPVKMEISRTLAAIGRVFSSKADEMSDLSKKRIEFFQRNPDISRPLSFMVSQKKWPIVRSEGWFVLAMMAGTGEGVQCVADIIHDVEVFQPLVELMTGKSLLDGTPVNSPISAQGDEGKLLPDGLSPEAPTADPVKAAEMLRIDRENALVLVSELLKRHGNMMPLMRKAMLEDLLKGGGALHVSAKEGREGKKSRDNGGRDAEMSGFITST